MVSTLRQVVHARSRRQVNKLIDYRERLLTRVADTLISRLVAWQMSPECQNVTWKLAKIIEHVPDSQTENLIAALITHLSHYDYAAGTSIHRT